MVLASLDNQGINVAFAVSSAAPPIATATKPAKKKDHDPPAAYVPGVGASSAAWIAGGKGAVAFATLGGLALGGVFDGPHHQKKTISDGVNCRRSLRRFSRVPMISWTPAGLPEVLCDPPV